MKITPSYARKGARRVRNGYSAVHGPVSAHGATKREAEEACLDAARKALYRLQHGPRALSMTVNDYGDATTLHAVLYPTVDGWGYLLPGTTSDGFTVTGPDDFPAMERSAAVHLAQALWSPRVDDKAFFAALPKVEDGTRLLSEIRSWVRFQREYIRLVGEGKTADEAHQAALGVL